MSKSNVLASGKTLVIDIDTAVLKIFNKETVNMDEIDIIQDINSPYVINIIEYNIQKAPYYIIYEKVVPIIKNISSDINENLKILKHISIALYHIHKKGYIHGDVARGNIGLHPSGRYVLYDFEMAKHSNNTEEQYRDVKMFLQDFIIMFNTLGNNYRESMLLYIEVLNRLKQKCETEHIEYKLFLGKLRERKLLTIDYDIRDFRNILNLIK